MLTVRSFLNSNKVMAFQAMQLCVTKKHLSVNKQIQPWPPAWEKKQFTPAQFFGAYSCAGHRVLRSLQPTCVNHVGLKNNKQTINIPRRSCTVGSGLHWLRLGSVCDLCCRSMICIFPCLSSKGIWQISFQKENLTPLVYNHCFRKQQKKKKI